MGPTVTDDEQLSALIALIPIGCPVRVRAVLPVPRQLGVLPLFEASDDGQHMAITGTYYPLRTYLTGYVNGWSARG